MEDLTGSSVWRTLGLRQAKKLRVIAVRPNPSIEIRDSVLAAFSEGEAQPHFCNHQVPLAEIFGLQSLRGPPHRRGRQYYGDLS